MDFFRNNYLKYNIEFDQLQVSIDNPQLPLGTYYEETIKQLKYVYDNKTKPLYIPVSGGLDSEFLVHTANELQLNFTTVICRWLGENDIIYNSHDITNAFDICEKLVIKPLIYDFNLDQYIESGKAFKDATTHLKGTFTNRFYPCLWLKIAKDLNGCVLLSGDIHTIKLDAVRNQWNFRVPRLSLAGFKTFADNNIEGCTHFLSYSSEMLFSFLLDPEIKKLCSGGYPGKIGHESIKALVYNRGNNFNLKPYNFVTKERIKLHGWEKLFESPLWLHPEMEKIKTLTYEGQNITSSTVSEYREDMNLFLDNHNLRNMI